jgi:hypothetical protein
MQFHSKMHGPYNIRNDEANNLLSQFYERHS